MSNVRSTEGCTIIYEVIFIWSRKDFIESQQAVFLSLFGEDANWQIHLESLVTGFYE